MKIQRYFVKNTSCEEVIDTFLQYVPEAAGNEEKWGIVMQMPDGSQVWLDPDKQLRDYEKLIAKNPTYTVRKKDATAKDMDQNIFIPETVLIVLVTHTRFMTSVELLKELLEKQ